MTFLSELMSDPVEALLRLAQQLPAILLALILHEVAHGYVAWRLGDPTAKMMGRLSLNPLRHLDPVGTLLLIVAGFGWAKPVPVDPRRFRRPRRDDLLVSLAGITMNLLLALLGLLGLYGMLAVCLSRAKLSADYAAMAVTYAYGMGDLLIAPVLGSVAAYFYQVLLNLVTIDLCLAIFNLLPVPPLDGYHVLNDLILKKSLYASRKVALIGQGAVMLLVLTGVLDAALTRALTSILTGVGNAFLALFRAVGLV